MAGYRYKTIGMAGTLVLAVLVAMPAPAGAATPMWRPQPLADPGAAGSYILDDVSCSARNACTAVGSSYSPGNPNPQTSLAERWDGTSWTVQATPNPPGVTDASLLRVSCPTATTCVALGETIEGQTIGVFAAVWDGTSWTLSNLVTPPGTTSPSVGDIDCVTATWCKLAGGAGRPDGTGTPWVATWNGATWSSDTVPLPASATYGYLSAIDCFSQTACAAVGNFGSPSLSAAGRSPALAETWNGKTWHADSAADPGGQTLPSAVSCPTSGTCFMAGWYRNGAGHSAALIEKKAGSLWLSQTAPQLKTGTEHGLFSIACTSTSNCEAIGFAYGGIPSTGYAAVFGGFTGWKVESEPSRDFLEGLSCPAKTYCIAVGFDSDGGGATSAIRS